MTQKHTPTPWHQYASGTMIHGADGYYIGVTQSKTPEADAAFIVRAVNSHDALVKSLEENTRQLERLFQVSKEMLPEDMGMCEDAPLKIAINKAKAALALAKGE